jgi:hypothetical protein
MLNFNGAKNIYYSSKGSWKGLPNEVGHGCYKFIKFDDFIHEDYLYDENYVASFIAKIDLQVV